MSFGKTLTFGIIGIIGLVGVWYTMDLYKKEQTKEVSAIPLHIVEADQVLATDDVLVLISLDKETLAGYQLGIGFDDFIHHPNIRSKPWGMLLRATLGQTHKLQTLAAGLYADPNDLDALEPVIVAHGDFDRDHLMEQLVQKYNGREMQIGKTNVVDFNMFDINSCQKSQTHRAHITKSRIIVGSRDRVTRAVNRLDHSTAENHSAELDVMHWQSFQQDNLVSVWLRKSITPPNRLAKTGLWQQPTRYAYETLEGFSDLFVAITGNDKRKRASVLLEAKGSDETHAAIQYALWVDFLKKYQRKVQEILPTVAQVINWVQLENQDTIVKVKAHIDRDTVANLKNLPDDLKRLFDDHSKDTNMLEVTATEELVDVIDDNPFIFKTRVIEKEIPTFDQSDAVAPPNATKVGPFSVFVDSISYDPDSGKTSLLLKSLGVGIPNIGSNLGKLKLFIDSVISNNGESAVENTTCGDARLNRPVNYQRNNKNIYQAQRRFDLTSEMNDLKRIKGKIKAKIPTVVDIYSFTVRGGRARSEQFNDVEFKLLSGSTSGFTYEIVGNTDRLVDIRGLNRHGKYLKVMNKTLFSKNASIKGEVVGGSMNFYGLVDTIQIVLASEQIEKEYPFELTLFDHFYENNYQMTKAPSKRLLSQKDLEIEGEVLCPEPEPGKTNAQVGPFCIQLTDIAQRDGLWMNFVVNVARLPLLEESFPFVKFRLDKAVLHNQQTLTLHNEEALIEGTGKEVLSSKLAFKTPWDTKKQLVSQALFLSTLEIPVNTLSELHGELEIELPKKLEVVTLRSIELGKSVSNKQFDAVVVSRSAQGEKILIKKGRNNLMHIVPRDKLGRPLQYEMTEKKDQGTDGLIISLKTGNAYKIDFHLAKERQKVSYPVELL